MPTDLRAELRDAAGTPPPLDADAVLHRARHLRRRNRLATVAAATAFVLAGVAGATLLQGGSTDSGVAESTDGSLLDVPPVGDTAAEHLVDGHPVFVVHHRDGEVSVIDAVSSHLRDDSPHLVGWCPGTRQFEELDHGGVYSEHGVPVAGPTDGDLHAFTSERPSERSVLVAHPPVIDPGPRPDPPEPPLVRNQSCGGGHGKDGWTGWNPGTTLHHTDDEGFRGR